jgi:hypothetical protein
MHCNTSTKQTAIQQPKMPIRTPFLQNIPCIWQDKPRLQIILNPFCSKKYLTAAAAIRLPSLQTQRSGEGLGGEVQQTQGNQTRPRQYLKLALEQRRFNFRA